MIERTDKTTALFPVRRALFSEDMVYRYMLEINFDLRRLSRLDTAILFIGLNPSTADEMVDDPTIRRELGFAKDLGFSTLVKANLFAYRATDPKDMKNAEDPIGPENGVEFLAELSKLAKMTIAAWGRDGRFRGRDCEVMSAIPGMYCLGTNDDGTPCHPLYLPRETEPELFNG